MVVLLAAAFLSLGLLDLDLSRGWWRRTAPRLAAGVPLVLLYAYFTLPPMVFPQCLPLLLLTLVPCAAISMSDWLRTMALTRRFVTPRRTALPRYAIAIAALLLYAGVLALAPLVDAGGLRDVAAATTSTAAPPTADLKHLRIVPDVAATFSGDKVVGQLGAYYRVGAYNIQAERGRLVWVAPLDFEGTVQWIARRTTPGVIVVDAENPDAPAELRQRAPLRYVPSALLNDNLARHVYLTYGTELLLEQTLQLDDAGDPRYLVTLGRPSIGWSGERVTAVVIVDPVSGAMERIPRERFAELPPWVSRVYPPELVLKYNDWAGRYVHGWWNAQVTRRDVHLPARDEVFGLLLADRRFVWFVDHTSPNGNDASMTGFTYTDSRTGQMIYYVATGGEFNSVAAERSVAANPIVRQGRLVPTQPILYNVAGSGNTWVVPTVADNGKFQTLALVQAAGGHVTVGNPSAGSPAADAFGQLHAFSGAAGPASAAIVGVLDRVASAPGRTWFTLRGRPGVYAVLDAAGPDAPLARSGDRVRFTTAGDEPGAILVRDFRDVSLR